MTRKTLTRAEKLQRFAVDELTGCHNWTGSKGNKGYGQFKERLFPGSGGTKLKHVKAYRASYELHRGPIPEGMLIRHLCNNPACINPEHLALGTNQDNVNDKMKAGRHWSGRGENHGNCKYTDSQIATVRELIRAGLSNKVIAKMVNMNWTYIANIKCGNAKRGAGNG